MPGDTRWGLRRKQGAARPLPLDMVQWYVIMFAPDARVIHADNAASWSCVLPDQSEIIESIVRNLEGMMSYSHWTVGIASKADRTEAALDYPPFWRYWEANTAADARAIKDRLVEQGMSDGGEVGTNPKYIFLY